MKRLALIWKVSSINISFEKPADQVSFAGALQFLSGLVQDGRHHAEERKRLVETQHHEPLRRAAGACMCQSEIHLS